MESGLPGKTKEEIASFISIASFKRTFDSDLDQFKTNMASTLEKLGDDSADSYLISTAELPFAELPPLVLGKLVQENGLNDVNPNQLSENAADCLELSHLMREAHGDLSLTYSAIGTLIERKTFERLPSGFIYGENNQTVGERLQEISALDRANSDLMIAVISF